MPIKVAAGQQFLAWIAIESAKPGGARRGLLMKFVIQRLQIVFILAVSLLLFTPVPTQAEAAKRLILKDGSYQLASQWQVSGDRVRYFSTERNEWEEVPVSMVDWPATENYAKQRESQRALELKDEEEEKPSEPVTIGPGLRLPNSGGVYLLDTYHGELELAELSQSSGELNRRTGHNILREAIAPISSSKHSIELKGEHAATQSHVPQPVIYLDIDQDPSAKSLPLSERFRLARLEPKKDARVLANLKVAITGKVSQQEFYLPSKAEQLQGGWIKLTSLQTLAAGEYAVVEMLDSKTVNSYVWDFGVNPSAPENPGAWRVAPQSSLPGSGAPDSDLEKRSK
jgi:hypothetical protein